MPAPAEENPNTISPRPESSRAFVALLVVMALGLVGILIFARQAPDWCTLFYRMSVGLMAAGAAMMVGGLLGFLFGIPRTLQGARPARSSKNEPDSNGGATYRANTNLEQISDWLTKILVGVGLTQLYAMPEKLQQLSEYIGEGLGGSQAATVFGGAVVIVYLICGFLLSYLWTRLYLPGAFRQADISALAQQVVKVNKKIETMEQQADLDATAISNAQAILNPGSDAPKVSKVELKQSIEKASPAAHALIFSQAQQLRKENWREKPELMARVIPIFDALAETDEKKALHRYRGQLGYSLKDQPKPDWKAAEKALTEAIEIRGSAGKGWALYEFNRALSRIGLANIAGGPTDPALKKAIIDDLKVAMKGGLRDYIERELVIQEWMQKEKIPDAELD